MGDARDEVTKVRAATSHVVRIVVLCLGYGCLLACAQWGALGMSYLGFLDASWGRVLAAQASFVLSMGCSLMAMRALARRGAVFPRALLSGVCVLGHVFCLMMASRVDGSSLSLCCWWAVMGALASHPLLAWFDAILLVYREYGRGSSIAAIAGSSCVSFLLAVPTGFIGGRESALALVV